MKFVEWNMCQTTYRKLRDEEVFQPEFSQKSRRMANKEKKSAERGTHKHP